MLPRSRALIQKKTSIRSHFLDLHLSISNGFVSSKIYDKLDNFDFVIVNFPFFGW